MSYLSDTLYVRQNLKIPQPLIHMAGHPVPHAFSTYVGYVLAQGTYLPFCKHRLLE